MKPCKSYVPGGICRDGFPFSGVTACSGRVCHACGRPDDKLPPCQNEDIGWHWLDDKGYPRLFRKERQK